MTEHTSEKEAQCTGLPRKWATRQSQEKLVRSCCAYLDAHLEDRVTLEQLAAEFAVSPTRLKDGFRTVAGMPVHAYLRTQKMREAARLLREEPISILEVSERLGYNNPSKFTDAFRRVYGSTPSAFRATERKINR